MSHFYITGTATAGSEEEGLGAKVNTFYTIRVEGLVVSHLGALNKKLPAAQMEALRQTEILIAPISGEGSLPKNDLQELVSAVQPRILIPVQFGDGGPEELENPESVIREMGITEIPTPSPRLNVTETNMPAELQVHLLRRTNS